MEEDVSENFDSFDNFENFVKHKAWERRKWGTGDKKQKADGEK